MNIYKLKYEAQHRIGNLAVLFANLTVPQCRNLYCSCAVHVHVLLVLLTFHKVWPSHGSLSTARQQEQAEDSHDIAGIE